RAADQSPLFESDFEIHLLCGWLIFAPRRMEGPPGHNAQRLFCQVRANRVEDLERIRLAVLADPAVQPHCNRLVRLRSRLRLWSVIGESAVKLAAPMLDCRVRRIV